MSDAAHVSEATIGRLPGYLQAAVDEAAAGASTVSSDRLASLARVNPATLRRDLSSVGITGTRGVGYDTKDLVGRIGTMLGLDEACPVVIVGIGNLGRALANSEGLADRGFPVRALIDVDPLVVGTEVAGVVIEHLDDVRAVLDREAISLAVLATPAAVAQSVADRLVAAGVGSVLNFTPVEVTVGAGVEVRRVDLATELQILSFYRQRSGGARQGVGLPLAR